MEDAAVTTTIERDAGFAWQMIRWQRSAVMMLCTTLFMGPGGFTEVRKQFPYMVRKMVERLLRPILNWAYVVAWLLTTQHHPLIG